MRSRCRFPTVPLIDALPGSVEERMATLAACGLAEARLLLRTPAELSEGQRYRFRLARAFAAGRPWVACDEFTATLDRTLAKAVAFNVRKLAARSGTGLLAATTHEDVLDDLAPDVLVRCDGDGRVAVERPVRKRCGVSSPASWRLPTARRRTGRTSHGGITAGGGSRS
jgi:ABC-type ATPase with predicted acetyltransferase domain